jgi:hypothetical protein
MRVALSVDGTSAGIFLDRMSGARGMVIVDPHGASAARLSFGSATFDTRIALDASSMGFPQRPAPIGGILHPSEHVRGRVGGDATKIELTLIDDDGIFEWTSPHPVSYECAAFAGKYAAWPAENIPDGTKTLLPKSERLPVRATKSGDVVARVRVQDVHVTKEEKGVSAIVAWTSLGTIVGWVDSAELVTPPPPTVGHIENHSGGGAGGGSGRMPAYATCVAGAPLFVLHKDKLYRVGHLNETSDPSVAPDWRVQPDGHVRLDIAHGQDVPRYLVLADDFRVTNSYWHQGIAGVFVVPVGETGCVKEAPREHPR